mgnify:FL=1
MIPAPPAMTVPAEFAAPARVEAVSRCYFAPGNPTLSFSLFGMAVRLEAGSDHYEDRDTLALEGIAVSDDVAATVWYCGSITEARRVFAREHAKLAATGCKWCDEPI